MITKLFRPMAAARATLASVRMGRALPYSKYWKNLSDRELGGDRAYCKKLIGRFINRHSVKSQSGLYHGQENKSGNTYCYSDKHKRHKVKVNVHKRVYYSNILGRALLIRTSMKAMRTIRKFGGLDNYILLTPESRMKSVFGEYLREILIRKMQDPTFKVTDILGKPEEVVHFKRKGKRLNKFGDKIKNWLWMPPEIRHQDLSMHYELDENEIPLKDKKNYEEFKYKLQNNEDINFDNEYFRRIKAEYESLPGINQKLLDEIEANRKKIFPTRALRRKAEEHYQESRNFLSQFPIDIY